uniref:Transmembrane protein n=1 Tax=Bursaphelenchus xylophilus TaxID=6326 RepID=A0A1I7S866_BURXY
MVNFTGKDLVDLFGPQRRPISIIILLQVMRLFVALFAILALVGLIASAASPEPVDSQARDALYDEPPSEQLVVDPEPADGRGDR